MFAMQKIIPGFTVSNPVDRKKGNVTDMAKKNTYDAGSISVLEGLEAVRKRPGMYIGSVSRKGLNHLIYEIVDNAVDEHLAGYCSLIHVILEKDGSCTVTDNGRGIPVDMHEKGVSAERLVFTTLHAGGKFDNSAYKTSGGLHGVGSSVVNALSTYLDIKISRDGYVHHDHYERGIPTIELEEGLLPKLGKTRQTGTSINFLPDPEIFEKTRFSATEVKSRLHETAYLNPELTIRFEDKRGAEVEDITYHEPDGIIGFIKDLNHSAEVLHDPVYLKGEADGIQVEVAFQFTNEFRENVLGFCNNIYNAEGGTHLTGFKTTFTTVMNTYAREIGVLKDKDPCFSTEANRIAIFFAAEPVSRTATSNPSSDSLTKMCIRDRCQTAPRSAGAPLVDPFCSPLFRLLGFLRLPVNGLPIGFGGFRLLFRSLRHLSLIHI